MQTRQVLAGVVLGVIGPASMAMTLASSGFDAGSDGWLALNGARDFQRFDAGGDPDGYIHAKDGSRDALWFFSAPSSYLGDISAAYGGTLSYGLMSDSVSPPLAATFSDVQLLGSNGVLLVYGSGAGATSDWMHYTVGLSANGGWHVGNLGGPAATAADLLGVLSGVAALRIRGDYKQAVETTGLDSVVLSSVPEPAGAALLLAGLAVTAGSMRRRCRVAA